MIAADARAELWSRFDAGNLAPDQLELRLQLVDEADGNDPSAVQAAIDGPIPQSYRVRAASRRLVLAGVALLAAAMLVIGVVLLAGDSGSSGGTGSGDGGPAFTVVPGRGVPVPLPAPVPDVVGPTFPCPFPGETPTTTPAGPNASDSPLTTVGCG